MSSVLTITIVLLVLAAVCLCIISLHNKSKKRQAGLLSDRFTKLASVHQLQLSVTDKLVTGMLGIDYPSDKLLVQQESEERCVDIGRLQRCRKQKKMAAYTGR